MTAAAWRVDTEALAEFLQQRRWFGGKGRVIRNAEVADVFPVRWPPSPEVFAVARARVTTDDGVSSYQLFLAHETRVDDALMDDAFRRGLVHAFARGETFPSLDGDARWVIASETRTPLVVPLDAGVTLVSTEQTNSSVIIESAAILKLYRKLEHGIHPDVEVTRFLTIERAFAHVPALLGSIRFEDADGVTTAGMLQELVPGAMDAWNYAVGRARAHMEGNQSGAGAVPFAAESRQLGGVTREMHEVLASGDAGTDFEMHAARGDEVTTWCQGARRTISRALEALEAALRDRRVATSQLVEARELLDRRAEFLQWPANIASRIGSDAGGNARTHGDYHLGQVLRSATDRFLIIDFEGEPARPLAERRARQSPLRDVAGMLRSFAYAAATAGNDEARVEEWERKVREEFLAGYLGDTHESKGLFPRVQEHVSHLLKLFEAEKVFYELHYELDHRPDWVWIPLRGITALGTMRTNR